MKDITIGRGAHCHIVIEHPSISRVHAKIIQQLPNGAYYYFDLSSNGTVVNGQKIASLKVLIKPEDVVLLAGIVPLPWNQVVALLPLSFQQQVLMNESDDLNTLIKKDRLEIGWIILAFFIPPAGLIMYLIWKDTTSQRAKTAGWIALVGLCSLLMFGRRFFYI